MTRRLLLTCSAAAWLIGMYLLYAHLVSPVVEPTQLIARDPDLLAIQAASEDERLSGNDQMALEHLSEQQWARNAKNQFRIGDMYLYADQIEHEAGKPQVRLRPFALVWENPRRKAGEAPLRITADEAVIEFEFPFDLTATKSGRPIAGSLIGDVRIDGPNGLQIIGRGFNFSEESLRLWCDSDVTFRYGPHAGQGHGLQVDFLPGDDKVLTPDMPRLGGLRTVSLLNQVVLKLMGEEGRSGQRGRMALKQGDQINVESDGRMQFDLEANLLTFDQNVRVRHPLPDQQQEGVNCDLLTLVLSSPPVVPGSTPSSPVQTAEIALTGNEAPANPAAMENWLPETLQLDKLFADGSGKRRIELFSQPHNLHCHASRAEYDLQRRMITLRDPASVDVEQGPQQLHAPEITLTLHENNRDIRQALARGAGSATSLMNDGRTVSAKWQKQLIKTTDPQTGFDIVELQGGAAIGLDQEYELSGDVLRIGLTPLAMSTKQNGPRPSEKAPPPRIERISGVGQIVLKSPQATAHTQRLDVTFTSVALPLEAPGQQDSLFGLKPADEQRAAPSRGGRGKPARKPAAAPLDVTAALIVAVIARDEIDEKRMALGHLTADGTVVVTQPMKPGEPAVQMLGQHLHVENILPQQQLVKLTGQPAQIRSGSSRLEGADIRMDRQANTLRVLGVGVLQHLVNSGLNGQALERPQILQVKWAEKLEFDGQTADFYEKVEASLQQTTMRCNAMHVTLLKPLRFDDPQLRNVAANRLELAKISCENKVEVDAREYLGNIIVSRSFGRLGQFVIDNTTGKSEAMGPGYFMEWRRGQRSDVRPGSDKAARNAAPQTKSQDWTYSRIDFQGLMKGNVHERFTTFEDHVEIVYGPVAHATDEIAPDDLPEGAASITCDALKVEQFAEVAGTPAYIRLLAEGNTKLEMEYSGHPIYAQADEVKYDESKDFYLLRSIGNQKVIINREPTTDDPRGRVVCARVEINRGQRNRTKPSILFVHTTGLNGIQ